MILADNWVWFHHRLLIKLMTWSLAKKHVATRIHAVRTTHDKIHFVNQFFCAFDSWAFINCNNFSFCANLAFCCSSVFISSFQEFSKIAGCSSKVWSKVCGICGSSVVLIIGLSNFHKIISLLGVSGSCVEDKFSDTKLLGASGVLNSGTSWVELCSKFSKVSQFVFVSGLLNTIFLSVSTLLSGGFSENISEKLRFFSVVSEVSHRFKLLFSTISGFVFPVLFVSELVFCFKSVIVL